MRSKTTRKRSLIDNAIFEALEDRQMFSGHSIGNAAPLGTLNHAVSRSDHVANGNTLDVFSVQHPGGLFKASITNSTQSLRLEIGQDLNGDGQITTDPGSNEVVSTSVGASPSLNLANLAAGQYFVSISQTAPNTETDYTLTVSPSDDAGGSNFATARDVAAPANAVFSDSIQRGTDNSDFFKLTLADTRQVTLQLSGLSQDAGMRVFRDVINPNAVDPGEQLFTQDLNHNNGGELSSVALSAGTYFVEVFGGAANSTNLNNYTLGIATAGVGVPTDFGGESTNRPVAIGALDTAPHAFSDFVGTGDNADFYAFTLNHTSALRTELRGLTADADVQIIQLVSNGQGGLAEQVVLSAPISGNSDEAFEGSLVAGNYFAKVFIPNTGDTNYLLKLQVTQVDGAGESTANARDIGVLPRIDAFQSLTTGQLLNSNGLVLPARASHAGVRAFNDRIGGVDTDDFYKFTLDDFRKVTVTMTGLNSAIVVDADLSILDSHGAVIQTSSHQGAANEAVQVSLLPGTYFARVRPVLNESNYKIQFTSVQGADQPGETLATAKNAGTLSSFGSKTLISNEFVGGSDSSDLFKFTTTKGFNAFLTTSGNTHNALQIQLIQDKNNNGVIDSGEVLPGDATSNFSGVNLVPGTYFSRVRISAGASVTSAVYSLNLLFQEIDVTQPDPKVVNTIRKDIGGTRATAFNLGSDAFLDRKITRHYVGADDTADVFKFGVGLAPQHNTTIKLSGLSGDADLFLLNADGHELAHSTHSGTTDESISFDPGALGGTFFVKVASANGRNTLYDLRVTT